MCLWCAGMGTLQLGTLGACLLPSLQTPLCSQVRKHHNKMEASHHHRVPTLCEILVKGKGSVQHEFSHRRRRMKSGERAGAIVQLWLTFAKLAVATMQAGE